MCKIITDTHIFFPGSFDGTPTQYVLTMSESAGWLKDPQNVLLDWIKPTQCDMIQVTVILLVFVYLYTFIYLYIYVYIYK